MVLRYCNQTEMIFLCFIYDFQKYKQYLRVYIADDLFTHIKGDTDSEWLFYMILTRYYMNKIKTIQQFHNMLEELLIDLQLICPEFTMNIICSLEDTPI